MTECPICIEKYNQSSRKEIVCPQCDYKICRTCTQTYLLDTHQDPHCMNCKNVWGREFMDKNFTKKFITKDLKNHRENTLFEREKCLLPETQPYVERQILGEKMTEEIYEKEAEINRLKRELNDLRDTHYRIRYGNINIDPQERAKFVRKCPVAECKGFLKENWCCDLCNSKICKECNEKKEDDNHVCDPNNVETAKLLKKDTKPCPSCGTMIFKISGCPQMWCTSCHVAFDWNTMRIERGVIHNPHFFEFRRNNNIQGRNPQDIPCGGRPELNEVLAALRGSSHEQIRQENRYGRIQFHNETEQFLSNVIRLSRHIEHYEIQYHYPMRTQQQLIDNNRELRIRYMRNFISDEEFKNTLQKREKAAKKNEEIGQVLTMVYTSSNDILRQICLDPPSLSTNVELLKKLRDYTNRCMYSISSRYNCVVPQINKNWRDIVKAKGLELVI